MKCRIYLGAELVIMVSCMEPETHAVSDGFNKALVAD